MMQSPFARSDSAIAVTLVTGTGDGTLPLEQLSRGIAVDQVATVRLRAPLHEHARISNCPACAALGDIRLILFELLQTQRDNLPARVIVDARGVADVGGIVDRLVPGRQPATALRDHTVAKSFHLFEVVEMAL